jgi:hypothetical protein
MNMRLKRLQAVYERIRLAFGERSPIQIKAVYGNPPEKYHMLYRVKGLVLPHHHYILVGMGANIIDNADLEKAAETARRLKRWEFMLTVLPVAIPGGTGFPVNPLAIF